MKKYLSLILSLLLCILSLASCTEGGSEGSDVSFTEASRGEIPEDVSDADLSGMDFEFTDRDKKGSYNESEAKMPSVTENGYEISSEGTYILSGDITDKTVTVNAGENDKIQIVLNNANITNTKGVAIYIAEADKVFITLAEGSKNSISDGSDYSLTDSNGELDGAIFSRADITVNGGGSLTVNGNYKHGIVSKDDLVIFGADITVSSKNVALSGKDCVKIGGASLDLTCGSDGIRSDNDEDSDRGFVYIESGKIKITAENDGIQAETAVKIDNGSLDILCGGGSGTKESSSDESAKGIKAVSDIVISNGEFNIDSLDDAIHSNNTVCIKGGSFRLSTGDDGVHADTDLAISAGEFVIAKSYEGLESSRIFITGGSFDITASDDGLNAAGGNDQSAGNNPFGQQNGGFGRDNFDNGIGEIVISDGYMLIDASGDGIDSNGTFALTGGTVLVCGPTSNGNGAFDYGRGASVTGGVLIAVGSGGMAQGFSQAENQGAILTSFSYRSGGTSLALCDESGNAIVVFTPKKDYQCAVITAPEIQQGKTYRLYAAVEVSGTDKNGFARNVPCTGGTHIADITMTSLLYGTGGGFRPGPGGGDHGGGPGGRR